MINPEDQFQIFDDVLFVAPGVITKVVGYVWIQSLGHLPEIAGYRLACDCIVPKSAIVAYSAPRVRDMSQKPRQSFKL